MAAYRPSSIARWPLVAAMAVSLLPSMARAASSDVSNSSNSTSTVISSLVLNLIIFTVEIVAFLILRPRFRKVYRPKTYLGIPSERTQALPDSLFGWIPQFVRTPTIEIMHKNGLDAYQFVAFLEMMLWMFVPTFIFTWIFLLPLYGANSSVGNTGFNMFTYGNVGPLQDEQYRLIGVLFANWIIILWFIYVMRRFTSAFVKHRQEFLLSPQHAATAQARTILITGIPNNFLSEKKLSQMYGYFPGGIAKIWLNRELGELPQLTDDRTKWTNKLEGAQNKLIKIAAKKVKKGKVEGVSTDKDVEMNLNVADKYVTKKEMPTHKLGAMGCFGEKVETIPWCQEEIARLTKEIESRQSQVETDHETYKPAGAAFILFNTQVAAHMAAKAHAHHEPYRMASRFIEAHPLDIIWPNLTLNPYAVKIRTAIGWAITIAIVAFWTVIVGFVGIVSNVQGLATNVSWLSWLNKIGSVPVGIIQGVLPTVLLAVLNILLVMFLRFLGRVSGIPTRTGVELSLFDRMSIFQLIQNFLILTIISGVSSGIGQIVDVLKNPTGLPTLLAQKIPLASTFFLSYILLQGLTGAASGFLQIAPLVIYYIKKFLLASTPRKVWHIDNDMSSVAWGTLFSSTTLLTAIAIGYMILAPIVSGFAMAAFFLLWLMYKYNFLYVYDMSGASETAGLFFPKAITFTFAAMYLEMVIMAVLFFLSQDSNKMQSAIPEGAFMVVLIVIVIGFQYLFNDSYKSLYTALPLSIVPSDSVQQSVYSSQHTPEGGEKRTLMGSEDRVDKSGASMVGANGKPAPAYGHQPDATMSVEQTVTGGSDEEDPMEAFTPPSFKDQQRDIWIGNDTWGIGRAQNESNRQHGLKSTVRDTGVDAKGNFTTDASVPPGEKLI